MTEQPSSAAARLDAGRLWAGGLATALPVGLDTDLTSRVATSVLNLALGIAITTTLGAVGRTAIRRGG